MRNICKHHRVLLQCRLASMGGQSARSSMVPLRLQFGFNHISVSYICAEFGLIASRASGIYNWQGSATSLIPTKLSQEFLRQTGLFFQPYKNPLKRGSERPYIFSSHDPALKTGFDVWMSCKSGEQCKFNLFDVHIRRPPGASSARWPTSEAKVRLKSKHSESKHVQWIRPTKNNRCYYL